MAILSDTTKTIKSAKKLPGEERSISNKRLNMKYQIFYFVLVFLCACSDSKRESESVKELPSNSIATRDSTSTVDNNIDDLEIDKSVFFTRMKIDTSFEVEGEKYHVLVTTDFDTTKRIVVPKKYVEVYQMNEFIVFESFTSVKIMRNDRVVLDTVLQKRDFLDSMDSSLVKYGNLMFPVVRIRNGWLELGQSLSIPMTDVGILVESKFEL